MSQFMRQGVLEIGISRKALIIVVSAELIGLTTAAFGWWGINTRHGRRMFPEMEGVIPILAFWSGCVVFFGTLAFAAYANSKGKRVQTELHICQVCGYDLRGSLGRPRCPECGQSIAGRD